MRVRRNTHITNTLWVKFVNSGSTVEICRETSQYYPKKKPEINETEQVVMWSVSASVRVVQCCVCERVPKLVWIVHLLPKICITFIPLISLLRVTTFQFRLSLTWSPLTHLMIKHFFLHNDARAGAAWPSTRISFKQLSFFISMI